MKKSVNFEAIELGTLLQLIILLRTLGEVKLYVKGLLRSIEAFVVTGGYN